MKTILRNPLLSLGLETARFTWTFLFFPYDLMVKNPHAPMFPSGNRLVWLPVRG
jgi:hypothetical protein